MYETIIIGSGIAGMTAAIYAARKKMEFLFLSGKEGGQFLESGEVLNYPGIVKTTGVEFEKTMVEQLKFNEVEMKDGGMVKSIEKEGHDYKVITDKAEYDTKSVIIATGAHPRELGIPGEQEYKRKGVHYCAVCDGPLYGGKDVAIIGGGNSALEAVDFLGRIANKIYVINLTKGFTAHEYLQERVNNMKNVEVFHNSTTKEVVGEQFVTGLKFEQDGQEKKVDVQGIFVDIGRVPNTDFAKGLLDIDEHGHIKIDCETRTSLPGIFAAGDCASGHEYQYVIAAGQGCMALLKAARYLSKKK